MKKNLLLTIFVLLSLLLSQCSKSEFDVNEEFEQEANFPTHIKKYGQSIATELRETVKNLHKMGIDYLDANETDAFKRKFYEDFYQASPTVAKTRGSINVMQMSPEEFVERINGLTKIQLEFIDRIIKECNKSISYADLANRLNSINKDIYSRVPNIQQERLLTIIAVLYYGMKEIQYLEEQDLMPATPQSNIKHLKIKTRSEPEGSFGDSCRKFLAATWVIAVGEPTPVGEVVASVVTVFVAGVLLYEVIACKKSTSEGSNHDYCQGRYERCSSRIFNGCSVCLQYCLTQGVWPPYSTHECS